MVLGGPTMRFSMSRTSWLTWLRIWRQHSAACSTLARSAAASGRDLGIQNGVFVGFGCFLGSGGVLGPLTRAFGDAEQQQGVLGEPLHLRGNDVLELQPPAPRAALGLLGGPEIFGEGFGGSRGVLGSPRGCFWGPQRVFLGYPDELIKPRVFDLIPPYPL